MQLTSEAELASIMEKSTCNGNCELYFVSLAMFIRMGARLTELEPGGAERIVKGGSDNLSSEGFPAESTAAPAGILIEIAPSPVHPETVICRLLGLLPETPIVEQSALPDLISCTAPVVNVILARPLPESWNVTSKVAEPGPTVTKGLGALTSANGASVSLRTSRAMPTY